MPKASRGPASEYLHTPQTVTPLFFSSGKNVAILTETQRRNIFDQFRAIVGRSVAEKYANDTETMRVFLLLRTAIVEKGSKSEFRSIFDKSPAATTSALSITWETECCLFNGEYYVIQQNLLLLAIENECESSALLILLKSPGSWKINTVGATEYQALTAPIFVALEKSQFRVASSIYAQDGASKFFDHFVDLQNNTILHHAVRSRHERFFKQVFDSCSTELDKIRNNEGFTPCELAASLKFNSASDLLFGYFSSSQEDE